MLSLPSTTQALHCIHRDINPGATGSGSLPQTTACGGSRMRAKLDAMPQTVFDRGTVSVPVTELRDGERLRAGVARGRALRPRPRTRHCRPLGLRHGDRSSARRRRRPGRRSRRRRAPASAHDRLTQIRPLNISHRLGNWRSWTASIRRRDSTPRPAAESVKELGRSFRRDGAPDGVVVAGGGSRLTAETLYHASRDTEHDGASDRLDRVSPVLGFEGGRDVLHQLWIQPLALTACA